MPFRLAMLGMWHTHAHGIVQQVAAHPKDFTMVGFYDRDQDVAAERRQRWTPLVKDFRLFDSPERLLEQPCDGVVVDGQVYENLALARLALERGKPIMLEKPAGANLDDYRRLVDMAQRKHVHIQMIYLFRYMSAVQEMLTRSKKGELGRVYYFRARLPKPLAEYDRFIKELAPYQGGMFFEMAGHIIDMMVAVLGRPKRITPFLAHHHRQGPANYIDNGIAVFEYDNAWGVIEVPAIEVAPESRRLEVFGTAGACVIPHLGSGHLANKNIQRFESYRQGQGQWQQHNLPAATLHIADLREFAAVVQGKKQPDFSMEHDLIVQESLLRASGMLAR